MLRELKLEKERRKEEKDNGKEKEEEKRIEAVSLWSHVLHL